MCPDLPDYEKRIIIVTPPGDYPALIQVDLRQILGTDLITPTIAGCVPSSIENPAIAYDLANDWFKTYIENDAIAYDLANDRFKVDIAAMTVGVIDINLQNVLGAAMAHDNPVISRLTDGAAFIDPRDRNWSITESLARSWTLGSSDIPDLLDKAARLLGIVYGDKGQLAQRATSKDLYVQLRTAGSEIDPTQIRALLSSDAITVYGSLDKLQQRATSKDLYVQIRTAGAEVDPTQIRALASATDKVSVEQSDETKLKATVTQAAKDRTISSVDATATPLQINLAGLNGNSAALQTPASGKKIRIKFISLEQSADVDLGYRFAAAGTIYYLRTTKGVYVSNLIGCNNEGAADESFYLYSSGATNVKGYILKTEV